MESLEAELDRARSLSVGEIADALEQIGFECTDCGVCCRADNGCGETADGGSDHTATIFPDEVRRIADQAEYDWRDVARPMPYGLDEDGTGGTFEWAIQTDDCGDCRFYDGSRETGGCTIYEDRPLICRTYPFSIALGGTSQPMGDPVERDGMVRAHECEGLGRSIEREQAEKLADQLKTRAIRELEEAIAVRDSYTPIPRSEELVVVHDSEGAKRPDGTWLKDDKTPADGKTFDGGR